MKLAYKLLVIGAILSSFSAQEAAAYDAKDFKGRIAITTDGNQHDHDDYGASPVSILLIAKAKLQNKLVHFDYNSHIEDSVPAREKIMHESVVGAAKRFGGFRDNVFFDDIKNLSGSIDNLTKEINASSAENPLYVVLGGPCEVLWRALKAANPEKRKHVIVVSHSWWNETHAREALKEFFNPKDHTEVMHSIEDIVDLGATYRPINEQNSYFNTAKKWPQLDWMKNHADENVRWVYSRIQKVGRPDYSDAGMTWYILTKNDQGKVDLLKDFIGEGQLEENAPIYPPEIEPLKHPDFEPTPKARIRLMSQSNQKYLNADKKISTTQTPISANSFSATPWTRYLVSDAGDGFVFLNAEANNEFVCYKDGKLFTKIGAAGECSKFRFDKNSDGSYSIFSKSTNGYLFLNDDKNSPIEVLSKDQSSEKTAFGKFDIKR